MKNYCTYLFLFLLLFFLNACDKEDDKSDEPNYGPEYFECKINGKPFQAVSIPFQCSGQQFDYYPEPFMDVPEGYCLISGVNCQTFEALSIRINGLNPKTGNLSFTQPSFADSIYPLYSIPDTLSEEVVKYEDLIDGSMTIDQFIPRKNGSSPLGTISGVFEFTVTDEVGMDTIRVTEGRFRFDVPQIF